MLIAHSLEQQRRADLEILEPGPGLELRLVDQDPVAFVLERSRPAGRGNRELLLQFAQAFYSFRRYLAPGIWHCWLRWGDVDRAAGVLHLVPEAGLSA
jgi:hypothetical protein